MMFTNPMVSHLSRVVRTIIKARPEDPVAFVRNWARVHIWKGVRNG